MSMRPANARWFELLTTHDDLTDTLGVLAHTGCIELELNGHQRMKMDLQDLRLRLQQYTRLERYYKAFWPKPDTGLSSSFSGNPAEVLDNALASLNNWEKEALPTINRLKVFESRVNDLGLLQDLLSCDETTDVDYGLLSKAGPVFSARLFLLPSKSRFEQIPETVLSQKLVTAMHQFLLLVGTTEDLDSLSAELALKKNTYVQIPPLPASKEEAIELIDKRQIKLGLMIQRQQHKLDALAEKYQLAQALDELHKMDWFVKNVSTLSVSNNFTWVTGWTSDMNGDDLRNALAKHSNHAILSFPRKPDGVQPPSTLQNPWWAKPFEIFTRMLGTPDRDEADPSWILALLTPLLFGYMFSDVGQGLVLLLAGVLLKKRWPLMRILIANGASAMLFGFVFGSVFGREDLIPALWLHPIEQPLPVLMVPLIGGVIIMLAGLILNAAEARWRGEWLRWLRIDAPVIVLYIGIVSAFMISAAFAKLIILSALTWFIIGSLLQAEGKLMAALAAAGSLIETMIQLLLNTVSFVRVGAFALAHAGLSMAFSIMADNVNSMLLMLLIMLLGNTIVIVLEGLVVAIQTTRLILFEFFIRFLQANGRVFKPLAGPPLRTVNN